MDLERCLDRVGYAGPRSADLATLAALQRAFLLHVPFENLDIHIGRPIVLETERFYTKIVEERRGGFCYECNGLFHAMLEALGFEVDYLAAAMLLDRSLPLDFGHLVLRVRLGEQDYLVDVGNGQSCRQPLRLDGGRARDEDIDYEVRAHPSGHALYYREPGGDWRPRFRFDTAARHLREFDAMCRMHQTSPQSRFTRHRLASLATSTGRVTLLDRELDVSEDGSVKTRHLDSDRDYAAALERHFGLRLPEPALEKLLAGLPAGAGG